MTTIIFSTTDHWLSRIIRVLTRSRVSHASICTEMMGVPVILQATLVGVNMMTRARWAKSNRVVKELRVVPDVTEGVRHAMSHLGEKYDVVGLLGFVPVLLWRWLGKRVQNPFASPAALVCSEFVTHLDHGGTIPEWKGLDPEATDPELLMQKSEGPSFSALLPGGDHG